MNKKDKKNIISLLNDSLFFRNEIEFAFIHGSFLRSDNYRDIDIALYLNKMPVSPLDYELQLETEFAVSRNLSCESDIRILNNSPLPFRFSVIKNGQVLFYRKLEVFADFKSSTVRDYQDFAFYSKKYLKEALFGTI